MVGNCDCGQKIQGEQVDIRHFGAQASLYIYSINMRLRRSIAILLLGVFLSTTMEAHQLLKLPALFEHLSEHRSDGPMSWTKFLADHYFHKGDHADQRHQHHDLPFQGDNHCATQTIHSKLPEGSLVGCNILNALDLGLIAMDEGMPIRSGSSDVWQPPKRA